MITIIPPNLEKVNYATCINIDRQIIHKIPCVYMCQKWYTSAMPNTKIINVLKDDSFSEILNIFKTTTAEEVVFVLPKKSKALSKQEHFATLASEAEVDGKRISLLTSNPQVTAMARAYHFDLLSGETSRTRVERVRPVDAVMPILASTTQDLENEMDDVRDSRDAFERDVQVPGDEIVETPLDEIDKEDVEDDLEEDEEDKDEESDELHDDGEPESLVDYDKQDKERLAREEEELEAETISFEENPETAYPAMGVARIDNNLDAIIATNPEDHRPIKIKNYKESPQSIEVRNDPTDIDPGKLENVWSKGPGQPGGSIWNDMEPKRKSLWARFFSLRKPTRTLATERPSMSPVTTPSSSSRFFKRSMWVASALVAVALIIFFTVPGKAHITIKPADKKLNLTIQVSASDKFSSVDSVFNKIPGQLFTIEKTVSKDFTATGQREVAQKARGTITVSNEFSSAPQTLIATTRFASTDGLVFRTLRSVTVPGMTTANGSVVAGKIDVEVIAEKPGPQYNLAPTTFKLPAFQERNDAERYAKFSGRSTEAFTKGATGNTSVVTDSDFVKAQDEVKAQLEQEIKDDLASQAGSLAVPASSSFVLKSIESTAQIDEAASTFTIKAVGTLTTMGYKSDQLWDLIKQYIDKNYNLVIAPEKATLEIKESQFSASRNLLEMTVALNGSGFVKIDQDKVMKDLVGKSEEEIRQYFASMESVAAARIILSPFWITSIPKNANGIEIKTEY